MKGSDTIQVSDGQGENLESSNRWESPLSDSDSEKNKMDTFQSVPCKSYTARRNTHLDNLANPNVSALTPD